MKKTIITLALSALLGCSVTASAGNVRDLRTNLTSVTEKFGWMPESKATGSGWIPTSSNFTKSKMFKSNDAAVTMPDIVMTPGENYTYVDMPDGTTWLARTDIRKEVRQANEYYTDYKYTGFTVTFYDTDYKQAGLIDYDIEVPEGMECCTNIQVGPLVTQKFFNTDSNYEIMVMLNFKPIDNYGAIPLTTVFSLRGADTPAEKVTDINGYYVTYTNAATDSWSEDFFIGFYTDEEMVEDVPEGELPKMLYTYTVYTEATYLNPNASPLMELVVDMMYVMADGDNEISAPIMLQSNNGTSYLATAKYAKTFFKNPLNFFDDSLNPDNSYVIDLYRFSGYYEKTAEHVKSTAIPCESPAESYTMRSYCLGRFSLEDDITFDFGDGTLPSYILTVNDADMRENNEEHFEIYDTDANKIKVFGQETDAMMRLNDINGFPTQYCFYQPGEGGLMEFGIYDYPSLEKVASIPTTAPFGSEQLQLSLTLDRVAGGAKYNYAVAALNGDVDENGKTFHPVAWFDHNGNFTKVDKVTGGENVVMMKPYIASFALDPYLFHTDDKTDYLTFVLRNENHGTSASHYELLVVNEDGDVRFCYNYPLSSTANTASLLNLTTNPAIWVSYYDTDTKLVTSDIIKLPLNSLEGEGTAESPYLISTAGDFALIDRNLSAHYRLTNDIDFAGATLKGFKDALTGSLDGAGFTMRNIVIENNPIFEYVGKIDAPERAVVKNLTLSHVTTTGANSVIVKRLMNADVENVFINDLNATLDGLEDFGAIANSIRFGSKVTGCGVNGTILAPDCIGVGGIAYDLDSEGAITACSFSGSITGSRSVGGIVGSISKATATVSDCHVNADLTARNTVGGIAGDSSRGPITRCFVEGNITATQPATEWSDYLGTQRQAINVGGVLGTLSRPESTYSDTGATIVGDFNTALSGNVVALGSINIPDDESLKATTHRIVGHTVANDDPVVISEKYNPSTYDYDIVWGDPLVETGLADNYAFADLAPVSGKAGETNEEGADVDAARFGQDFLAGLGYGFYGYSATEPWIMADTNLPQLHFEPTIGAYMVFEPIHISLDEGETAYVLLKLENIEFDSLTIESSDETNCTLNPIELDDDGNAICEVTCLKAGTYTHTASNGRITATLLVTGVSGITQTVTDAASAISFDGVTVSAPGCRLTIYSISGVAVASGADKVSASSLAAGVYAVAATDATGQRSTLKIIVK